MYANVQFMIEKEGNQNGFPEAKIGQWRYVKRDVYSK